MQRFDVCRLKGRDNSLVVLLQHDATSHLSTCIVAPLIACFIPEKDGKIRPVLQVLDQAHQLQTDRLAAIPRQSIGERVASAEADQDMIKNAIDRLFLGF